MAIGSTMQWRVRAGGDNLNGGGFDPGVSGAGTDYTDQDAAQLSLTDLACANNTTLTSATGGFTAAMIGNVIRIASGTHFTAGYYVITARTDTNTVTLDRNPTDGSSATGGTGRLGGAFAGLDNFWAGGTITQPTITSPLAAGHTVYIRGSGSDDPVTDDYTIDHSTYATLPNGTQVDGPIRYIGYNGRPRFNSGGLLGYNTAFSRMENLMFFFHASSNYYTYGLLTGGSNTYFNVRVDINGISGAYGIAGNTVAFCHIMNSGTTSAGGTGVGIIGVAFGGVIFGNRVENTRGAGIKSISVGTNVVGNLVVNNGGNGIEATLNTYGWLCSNNTIHNNGGDGISLSDGSTNDLTSASIINNLVTKNGGYGINIAHGSAAFNDAVKFLIDYNVFNNNTSGPYHNISAGDHDVSADPDYAADYTPQNPALEGTAFPIQLP